MFVDNYNATESRMTTARTLEASHKRLFSTHSKYARFRIEDDHIPFLREGNIM